MNGAIHTCRPGLAIGNSRKHGNTGNVYAPNGDLIGRVFKQSRRLRENGGAFGEAWTAMVILPDGREVSGSLGTRHPDRWHAARAIRAFWRVYPPHRIARLVPAREARIRRWYSDYSNSDIRMVAYLSAAGHAVACFKYDEHEACGLTARYRGADPRRHEAA